MKKTIFLLLFLLVSLPGGSRSVDRPTRDRENRFRELLDTLCSPAFGGRPAQQRGDTLARLFLHKELLSYEGMLPIFGDGFQCFSELSREGRITSCNVGAILPGSDSVLGKEIILIGAHFDHMGIERVGIEGEEVVLYGADDNASGTAMVLELARWASENAPFDRSLAFVFFGAEEVGLVGSKFLADHLPWEREDVFCMINFDIVGRLTTERGLQILGTVSSPALKKIASAVPVPFADLAEVHFPRAVLSASDHRPFYDRGIPILFFNTGVHVDYHNPTDLPDRINYYGMVLIHEYATRILSELDRTRTKLTIP